MATFKRSDEQIDITLNLKKGTHENTEIKDGVLQLVEKAEQGAWLSELLDIDKAYKSISNVFVTFGVEGEYKVFARTGEDKESLGEWVEQDTWGEFIGLAPEAVVQLKLELFALTEPVESKKVEFNNEESVSNFVKGEDALDFDTDGVVMKPTWKATPMTNFFLNRGNGFALELVIDSSMLDSTTEFKVKVKE